MSKNDEVPVTVEKSQYEIFVTEIAGIVTSKNRSDIPQTIQTNLKKLASWMKLENPSANTQESIQKVMTATRKIANDLKVKEKNPAKITNDGLDKDAIERKARLHVAKVIKLADMRAKLAELTKDINELTVEVDNTVNTLDADNQVLFVELVNTMSQA